MISGGTRWARVLLCGFLAVLVAACDPPQYETCYDVGGEEVCDTEGGTVRMTFPFDASEAESYVVRFHPDDARRYHLNEVVPVTADPNTSRTKATIERLEPGPSQVCLTHNVYLQNIVEREQTLVFEAGKCGSLSRDLDFSDADWMSY